MKFGKTLKRQIEETLPEWRDKFLSYKELKKRVRLISSSLEEEEVKDSMSPCSPPISSVTCSGSPESAASCGVESNKVSMEAASFIFLLDAEIEKFNSFFMEQEEEFIIRHKELQERIQDVINKWGSNGSNPSEVEYKEHMKELRKEMVNFHGEMVLLEYYSNVNYTGMAKILKKYDKRTGRLLRLPFIEKVSQQPFFTTDLLSKLVKDCENIMCAVFPVGEDKEGDGRRVDIKIVEESVFKNIVAALVTLKEIRRGSSTYSPFSLPPMNLDDQYPDPKDSFII